MNVNLFPQERIQIPSVKIEEPSEVELQIQKERKERLKRHGFEGVVGVEEQNISRAPLREAQAQAFVHAAGLRWLSPAEVDVLMTVFPTWYSKREHVMLNASWSAQWSEYKHSDGMPEPVLDQIEEYGELFDNLIIATTEKKRVQNVDPLLLGVKTFTTHDGPARAFVILAQWGTEELADIPAVLKWVQSYSKIKINFSALTLSYWLVAVSFVLALVWSVNFSFKAPVVFHIGWGIVNFILGVLLGYGFVYPNVKSWLMRWQARTRPELRPLKARLLAL